jgi:hypothetical protein
MSLGRSDVERTRGVAVMAYKALIGSSEIVVGVPDTG